MEITFAPLFQLYAIVKYPIRYFLLLFMAITGAFYITNDLSILILDRAFGFARSISYPLLLSILIFISQYLRQKKLKQTSEKVIAAFQVTH